MKKQLTLLIIFVVAILFYWFQFRPAQVRQFCDWSVRWGDDRPRGYNVYSPTGKYYEQLYSGCLHRKGLK